MKPRHSPLIRALLGTLAFGALPLTGKAATLSFVSTQADTSGSLNISVFDGKAATDFGQLGDGTLSAYRFWGQDLANAPYSPINLASKGGIIGDITATAAGDGLRRNTEDFDIWTTTDPGALTAGVPAFDSTADFGGSTITGFSFSRNSTLNGTINITGLASGNVFFAHNPNFNDGVTVTLTMSGAGQTNLVASHTQGGNNTETSGTTTWLTEFSFDNADGLYTEIAYSFSLPASFTEGNFSGVMVDAVPEPSAALLGGLGLLALLRRRR